MVILEMFLLLIGGKGTFIICVHTIPGVLVSVVAVVLSLFCFCFASVKLKKLRVSGST